LGRYRCAGSDALDESVASPNSLNNAHVCCRTPQWVPKSSFDKALEAVDPRRQRIRRDGKEADDRPVLRACFVEGFPRSPTRDYPVYRVKVWLERLPALEGSLRVTYELHPETERPISRIAFGLRHEMWLNTNSNYRIRARTNDGREWDLGWLYDALASGGVRENVKVGDAEETFENAHANVRTTREEKDQLLKSAERTRSRPIPDYHSRRQRPKRSSTRRRKVA
jgi:hypothetical protein